MSWPFETGPARAATGTFPFPHLNLAQERALAALRKCAVCGKTRSISCRYAGCPLAGES